MQPNSGVMHIALYYLLHMYTTFRGGQGDVDVYRVPAQTQTCLGFSMVAAA